MESHHQRRRGVVILTTLLVSMSLILPYFTLFEMPQADTTFWQMHLTFVPYEQRRLELDFGVPATTKKRSKKEILMSWIAQNKSD